LTFRLIDEQCQRRYASAHPIFREIPETYTARKNQPTNSEIRTLNMPALKKIDDIELLRAVAIIFTLIQHLGPLLSPSKETWLFINKNNAYWGGVDLFFCISGFVISKRMFDGWHDLSSNERWREIKNFWIRRFFRIIPTLWLWVGISLLGALFFNSSGAFGPIHANLMDAMAAILNYANIHVFLCVIGSSQCGPNPVYWSLSLEEQFYIILPLLFFIPRGAVIKIAIIGILIQLPIHRAPWDQSIGGALWFIRTDAILLGVLIAYYSTKDSFKKVSDYLSDHTRLITAIVFFLIFMLSATPRSGFYFAAAGISLISAALVFIASLNKDVILSNKLLRNPFLWVGSRSFSLYLLHFPIYYAANEIAYLISGQSEEYLAHTTNHPALGLITLVTIFIAAEANFRLIERPFRKLGHHFSK
jgi:peptidoglycan/LPS O-acetylase OafA/YrhL